MLSGREPEAPFKVAGSFESWAARWLDLADFPGPFVPDPERRIAQVLDLWNESIPGRWERGLDTQLLGPRYRRGDAASPRSGEHQMEAEILKNPENVRCLDGRLVDGINAMPLARDSAGGRRGNIEADLFLLIQRGGKYRLALCEVKRYRNTAWYAAIENLRQLRLLNLSAATRGLFSRRNPQLSLPSELPVSGLIVAPEQYFVQRGQKSNAVPPTLQLLKCFTTTTGIEADLATWEPAMRGINKFVP